MYYDGAPFAYHSMLPVFEHHAKSLVPTRHHPHSFHHHYQAANMELNDAMAPVHEAKAYKAHSSVN